MAKAARKKEPTRQEILEADRKIAEMVQIFGDGLQREADRQVALKAELEQRWLDDLRHYHGKVDEQTAKDMFKAANKQQSTITVNLTRARSNSAEARWSDLVLPTDDRNWGIQPTPVPEMARQLKDMAPMTLENGQPVVDPESKQPWTRADAARAVLDAAKEAADAMQDEIDDQLNECHYNAICRDVIHDAVVLGTGIMKGPMIESRARKQWVEGSADEDGNVVWMLNRKEEKRPFIDRVDPWNFFPDMSATCWKDVERVYERHLMTRKQVKALARRPGFLVSQLVELLKLEPNTRRSDLQYLNQLREINGISNILADNRYELWEYHGPIRKEHLLACGYEGIDPDDPMEEYEGVVWFSQGIVLKVGLNHMDDDSLPYSVLNWEKDDTSVFGFGVPYRMRNPQRVMNASWRMILDNAGLSTGPQIVVNRKLVTPADGKWTLAPRKLWWFNDETGRTKVEDVFDSFNIDSHQSELSGVFEMAHRLSEEETGLPQLQMGTQPAETQQPAMLKTLGGTALWMTSGNIMMRNAVKNFDDDITVPVIGRMYDWNMQFNPKQEIKGDYKVDARGTSVLLVREMQARQAIDFVNIALAIPGGAQMIKGRELLEETAKAMSIGKHLIKTEDELQAEAQQQGQQMDPESQKLQLQLQIEQLQLQQHQIDSEMMYQAKLIEREVELTKLAVQERADIAEIQSKNNIESRKEAWSREQFYQEIGLKLQKGTKANIGLGGEE